MPLSWNGSCYARVYCPNAIRVNGVSYETVFSHTSNQNVTRLLLLLFKNRVRIKYEIAFYWERAWPSKPGSGIYGPPSVSLEVIPIKILKSTLLVLAILSANIFIESPFLAEAANVNAPSSLPYTTIKLSLREEGLEIKGVLPYVQNLNGLGAILNEGIDTAYSRKVAAAKESKARSITFRCSYFNSGDIGVCSILMTALVTTAVSKEEVVSFNYIPAQSRLVGVNDILGPNGLQIANKVITQQIRADSERYYTNFPGFQDTDAFYVTDDGNIWFLFDAFQIAPGSEGVTRFPMKISGVISTPPIRKGDGYWIKDTSYNLKMVSLRTISDSLGYSVNWDRSTPKSITVERRGDVTVNFKIDENAYKSRRPDSPDKEQKRSLESAPVLMNGITYVPISFFDQILELVAYHVDENDNIIFTTYLY